MKGQEGVHDKEIVDLWTGLKLKFEQEMSVSLL